MTTYVHEAILSMSRARQHYFKFKQNMNDFSLKKPPETVEPIRCVVLGGFGVLTSKPAVASLVLPVAQDAVVIERRSHE